MRLPNLQKLKKKKEENKKEPFSHPAFGALCLEYSVCKISVGFFLVLHNGSVTLWTRLVGPALQMAKVTLLDLVGKQKPFSNAQKVNQLSMICSDLIL